MKKTFGVLILPVFLTSFIFISCNSCKNMAEKKEQKKLEMEQEKTLEDEIETHVYPLPTSAEVIKMLTDLEVGYNIGITNPVSNTKKYFESTKKAINMGVYGADLSYVTLYNIQQEVINYLDVIRSLTNDLNMSKVYDQSVYDSIRANFDYKDELVKILTRTFEETYSYLSENDQQDLALLVVGGAWVEGMYLTTHVSAAAYNVAGISKNLIEQKKSFELYLEITKSYSSDPVVSDFVKLLDPIKKVYEGLTTSLYEKDIRDITKAIEGVRAQIVE
ncbi:MAG: hypothetical protein MUO72_11485 [Bacteroidales bacterium]|nr:hypothetical protein [Bacteroidales bacterium]